MASLATSKLSSLLTRPSSATFLGKTLPRLFCSGTPLATRGQREGIETLLQSTAVLEKQHAILSQQLQRLIDIFLSSKSRGGREVGENLLKLSMEDTRPKRDYQGIEKLLQSTAVLEKQHDIMSQQLQGLINIFLQTKSRGEVGENLLKLSVESTGLKCDYQHKLSNNKRVDALVHIPGAGNLAVDSKFPKTSLESPSRSKTRRASLAKHVNDISKKYILPGETLPCAVMYIPSPAIHAEIASDFPDLIQEASKKGVVFACPTLLPYILTYSLFPGKTPPKE